MNCDAAGCNLQATVKSVCGICRNYGDRGTRNFCGAHKANALPCGHTGGYFWPAGYRFPNTSSKTKVVTTLDHEADWTTITTKIDNVRNVVSRHYIFVGETHSSCYDKAQTRRLARRYGGDDRVILVAERGILPDGFWRDGRPDNLVEERDRESPSGSPQRNENLVAQIVRTCDDDDAERGINCPRPVVILCGDDHGDKLCAELVVQAPYFRHSDGREAPSCIQWTHYVSAADTLDALPSVAPGTMAFVGFIEFGSGDYVGAQPVSLLEKDKFHGAFDVTVVTQGALMYRLDTALVRTNFHFAFYMPAGPARTQVFAELDLDGETVFRITGKTVARVVRIDTQLVFGALVDQSRLEQRQREQQ